MKSPALGEKEIEKNNSKSTCCRHLPTCNHLLFYFFSYTLLSVENRALNEKKISRMMRNEKSNLKVNWADYQWKQMVICVFFSPFLDLYAMACELLVPTHKRKICGDLFFLLLFRNLISRLFLISMNSSQIECNTISIKHFLEKLRINFGNPKNCAK